MDIKFELISVWVQSHTLNNYGTELNKKAQSSIFSQNFWLFKVLIHKYIKMQTYDIGSTILCFQKDHSSVF